MYNSQIKPNTDNLTIDMVKMLYRDKKFTVNKIASKLDVSFWRLYDFMNKHNIVRRDRSEATYLSNKLKPQFIVKDNLSIAEEKLKVAGIMLYWAEGTLKGNTVDFVNSNPDMVKVFLKFLRQICGIDEKRLKLYLYAYSICNLKQIKNYWRQITGIPLTQFTKPYIRLKTAGLSGRKLPYGVVHVRYNDKKLLETIDLWIKEYANNIWAGTQVAKGGRLCKSSFMPKGMMKK